MNRAEVIEFMNTAIDMAINAWKTEIYELKHGGCGTPFIGCDPKRPFAYQEERIENLENIRAYIKENLK